MKIFNFLKKLRKQPKPEPIVKEKLSFAEIKYLLEKKIQENKNKEKQVLVLVKEKIEDFIKQIKEKIIVLEAVDVEARKEKEKIKGIVINSRKDYINSIEFFLERLRNLEIDNLEETMEKINKLFFELNKSSYKNYERATILIGKEMSAIKESLKVFSKEILQIFEKNKEILNSAKKISELKSKLENIINFHKYLDKVKKTMVLIKDNIAKKEKENKKLLKEINKIKQSSDYLERLKTQDKISFLNQEVKKDLFNLKQIIDFKALANFFHINQEQIKILKEYKENFQTSFQKDNGKTILDFLNEAKLNNSKILEKINLIQKKIQKVSNYEKELKPDKTQQIYPKIRKNKLEIEHLKIEEEKQEKRKQKLITNREQLMNTLKQGLTNMNIKIN